MQGYYRHPTVHRDRVVFVSDDDLWEVPLEGGRARRLTAGLGEVGSPAFSPDGEHVALVTSEEGSPDVYRMESRGGPLERLTFDGASHVVGWEERRARVIYASARQQPHGRRQLALFSVPAEGGSPRQLPLGEGVWLARQPGGDGRVIGRHRTDLARWKRYRGGLAGQLWAAPDGDGPWRRLFAGDPSGLARPMWIGDRIWFLSDREGHGNLYSCRPDGQDLTRHTDHEGFFARHCRTDGDTIVYVVGGELWRLDVASGQAAPIEVQWSSPRTQRRRKFVDAAEYLEAFDLHPEGHSLAVTTRGKAFNFGHWDGAVRQTGAEHGVRYREAQYLGEEGHTLLVVSDEGGEERLERHAADGSSVEPLELEGDALGRVVRIVSSPDGALVALTNHRHELIVADLEAHTLTRVDRSEYQRITDVDVSPDGRWLAYSKHTSHQIATIFLWDAETGQTHQVTEGEFLDTDPAFDPEGRYLYFVSYRHFDPVYGNLFFELSLSRGQRPCLVTLREDVGSPFVSGPRPLDGPGDEDEERGEGDEQTAEEGPGEDGDKEQVGAVEIDLERIQERVIAFPVSEGRYEQLVATEERVFWIERKPRGALASWEGDSAGRLRYWCYRKNRARSFHDGVDGVALAADGRTLGLWTSEDELRVVDATGSSPDEDEDSEQTERETGWIDLERISVEIDPGPEWRQMLREIWRLMRDHFWREDMSGVDWEQVWGRYAPLLDRVSTRGEFSDLVWTMQGELGTSHAYEMGGDYREGPDYAVGALGVDVSWDGGWRAEGVERDGGYRITHIVRGDDWDPHTGSPLRRPGLDVEVGDVLLAINGKPLDQQRSPTSRLVEEADCEVELLLYDTSREQTRRVTARALHGEGHLRYREWVRTRREIVHERTGGRVGYVHVPDMGPRGYAEFHRALATELRRDALIVDVRFNGGGHVSSLLLEKLSRAAIGFDIARHSKPFSYPQEGPRGPLVALTNEYAGSDGDIFSHCFKLLGLGPLIGQRTWGGVIGIWPRHALVDGSVTTQPEFSFWFFDVGFGVENWGTEPDIEVALDPLAGAEDEDPQLEVAIDEALQQLEGAQVGAPEELGPWPDLAPPRLGQEE